MTLTLKREPSAWGATIGRLYIDGVYECLTLEDEIREVAAQPVKLWKVPGRTAVPAGRYHVLLTPSARFNRVLPQVLDVPGFSGVRIHAGNGPLDTEGCILVGRSAGLGSVSESQAAFYALMAKITAATGPITMEITNPVPATVAAPGPQAA